MSRYYWISAIVVLGLTAVLAITTQKKSGPQIAALFFMVVLGIAIFAGVMAGIAHLLIFLGIAEKGFVL